MFAFSIHGRSNYPSASFLFIAKDLNYQLKGRYMMHVPPWPIILLKILLVSLCFQNEASAPASALRARAIP